MTLEEAAQAVAYTIQSRFEAIGFDAPDSLQVVGTASGGLAPPEIELEAGDGRRFVCIFTNGSPG